MTGIQYRSTSTWYLFTTVVVLLWYRIRYPDEQSRGKACTKNGTWRAIETNRTLLIAITINNRAYYDVLLYTRMLQLTIIGQTVQQQALGIMFSMIVTFNLQ